MKQCISHSVTTALFAMITFLLAARTASAETVFIGYLPSTKGMESPLNSVNMTPYTHIMLAFVNPDPQGRIVNGEALAYMTDEKGDPVTAASLNNVIKTLHTGAHKVMASIAGGILPGCAGDWADLTSPAKRDATVSTLEHFATCLTLGVSKRLE